MKQRQSVGRRIKSSRRRKYKLPVYRQKLYVHNHYLHKYEDEIIVKIICEEGGVISERKLLKNNRGRLVNKNWKQIWRRLLRSRKIVDVGNQYYRDSIWRLRHRKMYAVVYGPFDVGPDRDHVSITELNKVERRVRNNAQWRMEWSQISKH